MTLALVVKIILFLVIVVGIFSYRFSTAFQLAGDIIAVICALIFLLISVGVVHL